MLNKNLSSMGGTVIDFPSPKRRFICLLEDELLKQAKELSGSELKVLLMVTVKGFAFDPGTRHRREGVHRFSASFLSQGGGLSRRQAQRALDSLQGKNLIRLVQSNFKNGNLYEVSDILLFRAEDGNEDEMNQSDSIGQEPFNEADEDSSYVKMSQQLRQNVIGAAPKCRSSYAKMSHNSINIDNRRGESANAQSPTEFIRIWNEHRGSLAEVKSLTSKRIKTIGARLREHPDLGYWAEVIKAIAASPFCTGENQRGWKANIDFLLRPDTHVKVSEGQYASSNAKPKLKIKTPQEYLG